MSVKLFDYQIEAVKKMKNGCIPLWRSWFREEFNAPCLTTYLQNGGDPDSLTGGNYIPMDDPPKDLYIITARKRDTLEWEGELSPFLLSTHSRNKLVLRPQGSCG